MNTAPSSHSAAANGLAIDPTIREALADWKVCERYRIERGYEWAPAAAKARRFYADALAAVRKSEGAPQ